MKSIEWDRGSGLIVLSVHFYGYKRFKILILIILTDLDFPELVFLISFLICFLNGHSEYSEFADACIDVLDIEFW